jgi:hypothetical protein
MTEYDSKDYEGDAHKAAIAGTIICIWGSLVLGMNSMAFPAYTALAFMGSLFPLGLVAVYFMFTVVSRSIDLYLCYEEEDEEEDYLEEEEYDPFSEYEENEYLQAEFTKVIEKLKLRDSLITEYEEEYERIRAGFSRTEYAHCRWANNYIEEGTLNIVCRDISEAAARRYGAGILVKGSLRFYRELSGKKKAIYLLAFFFGLIMSMPIMLGSYLVSWEFGIGTTVFTVVVFTWMWNIGKKQNEEARKELSAKLRTTGVYNDYEFEFYKRKLFSISSRFDKWFLIGFLLVFLAALLANLLWV